jgi:hypothetical protein
MELNEYDKEVLVVQSKPIPLLIALKSKPIPLLSEYKDFKYKGKYVYYYDGAYMTIILVFNHNVE